MIRPEGQRRITIRIWIADGVEIAVALIPVVRPLQATERRYYVRVGERAYHRLGKRVVDVDKDTGEVLERPTIYLGVPREDGSVIGLDRAAANTYFNDLGWVRNIQFCSPRFKGSLAPRREFFWASAADEESAPRFATLLGELQRTNCMMAFQMYVRDGAGMRLATLESNGVVTTRYREEEIHHRVPPDRSLVEDVAAPHIWQFVIDRQVQGAPTFDAEVSEEMLGGVQILAPPSPDRVDEGEETGDDDDDRDDDDDGDGDGDDICPLCADEATDGRCVNGGCDASEKCPACGRVLNHDGVCENVSCSLGESQRFLSTFPG